MARRALDEALARARSRQLFGRKLAEFQPTQMKLGEMALSIGASVLLVYRAAWTKDVLRTRVTREASMAKLFSTESAQQLIDTAVQLFGGMGVVRGARSASTKGRATCLSSSSVPARCRSRTHLWGRMATDRACAPQPCAVVARAGQVQPAQRRWSDAQGEHIDVRGLPMPQPLVAILRLVREQSATCAAVVVHHERDPALLYAELADLGWTAERIEGDAGEVRLRLTRLP
jgi:hypothetical protein